MKKVIAITVVFVILILMSSCSSNSEIIGQYQTEIAVSNTEISKLMSATPKIVVVTATPIPDTPTPSPTNTPLYTATPTLQEIEITQTKQAFNLAATQSILDQEATSTARIRTATSEAKSASATEMASYISIPKKELITYPENYIGEKVYVYGRVFNVLGNVIQIYFSGTYDALYVNLKTKAAGIYENDYVTVYGTVQGKECFTNTMGNEICQPALNNAWFVIP